MRTYFVCATPRSGSTLLCRLLAATGPLVVEYERLAADHTATLRDVLAHLELEVERIPDPPMDRQGDERSDRWVARFDEEKELV